MFVCIFSHKRAFIILKRSMKFWAERGHVVQMKTGMVGMGGLGSLVNYQGTGVSASLREWAHLVVTGFQWPTSHSSWDGLFNFNLKSPFREDRTVSTIRLISSKSKDEPKPRWKGVLGRLSKAFKVHLNLRQLQQSSEMFSQLCVHWEEA